MPSTPQKRIQNQQRKENRFEKIVDSFFIDLIKYHWNLKHLRFIVTISKKKKRVRVQQLDEKRWNRNQWHGWARAANPHPHPMPHSTPFPTQKHTQKASKTLVFPLFDSFLRVGQPRDKLRGPNRTTLYFYKNVTFWASLQCSWILDSFMAWLSLNCS